MDAKSCTCITSMAASVWHGSFSRIFAIDLWEDLDAQQHARSEFMRDTVISNISLLLNLLAYFERNWLAVKC